MWCETLKKILTNIWLQLHSESHRMHNCKRSIYLFRNYNKLSATWLFSLQIWANHIYVTLSTSFFIFILRWRYPRWFYLLTIFNFRQAWFPHHYRTLAYLCFVSTLIDEIENIITDRIEAVHYWLSSYLSSCSHSFFVNDLKIYSKISSTKVISFCNL